MQVRSTAAKLKAALETAKSVTPSSAVLLAYAGVAISGSDDHVVRFTGSDGDTTVAAKLVAHVDEPGEVLVLPRPLAAFLAAVPGQTAVQLRSEGGFLMVERTGAKPYRFATLAASRVVPVLDGDSQPAATGHLASLVAAVRAAAGRDGAVRVSSADGQVALAATDSYRLSVATSTSVQLGGFDGVLSLGALELLARHGFDSASVQGRSLNLAGPDVEVQVRPLAVAFPGIDRVLETKGCASVEVPVSPWRDALRRLDSVSSGQNVHVQVCGREGEVELQVAGGELGSGEETVPVTGDASGLDVALRVSFLADALSSFKTGTFRLLWTDGKRPVHVVCATPELQVQHVIMPVRV